MKNIIVTIAEILLGIALFGLIFSGEAGSLKGEAQRIFTDVIEEMHDVAP